MFNRFKSPSGKDQTELVISNGTYFRITFLIVATILGLAALKIMTHSLVLIFISFFLALALNGPVSAVARRLPGKIRGSRPVATTIAFLIVVVLLGAFLASLVPPLVKQTESFVKAAPSLVRDIQDQNGPLGNFVRHYGLEKQLDTAATQLTDRIKNSSGQAFSTVKSVGSSVFAMLTILAMTFMMLVEGPRHLDFLQKLLPRRRQEQASRIANDMYKVVKGYVNGQVLLAAVAAIMISPVLFLFHVSYPIALVFVIFICGLIPMIGHTIGATIVTVVALFASTEAALVTLAWYITYQQIENFLIQPRIQANSTDMSPLLVFASVVIGVSFSGLLGGLVAIPVAGCIRVAVLEYLRAKDLIDDEVPPAIAPKAKA